MIDEVWKDFFVDHQGREVLNKSEVWRNYAFSEIERDKLREKRSLLKNIEQENSLFDDLNNFREKINSNKKLKEKLKTAANYIKEHPEIVSQVDPNFINGLKLLDFED